MSETERRLLKRIEGSAATSRLKRSSSSPEKDNHPSAASGASVAPLPSPAVSSAGAAPSQPTVATERPNFVRVVTSDGRQVSLLFEVRQAMAIGVITSEQTEHANQRLHIFFLLCVEVRGEQGARTEWAG